MPVNPPPPQPASNSDSAPNPQKPSPAATKAPPAATPRLVSSAGAARADAAARITPEAAPEEPADGGSSAFIFYTGVGIAAVLLLLSVAAFMRSGSDDNPPRSL